MFDHKMTERDGFSQVMVARVYQQYSNSRYQLVSSSVIKVSKVGDRSRG